MAGQMVDAEEPKKKVHDITDANLTGHGEKVGLENFELLKVLGTGAYGKVFLVRKICGHDAGVLYAMKVLKKATIITKPKTTEHTMTERQVLEAVRQSPFLVTLHYAFQTNSRLHLILDYVNGGEMFTHLNLREHFTEPEVKIFIAEILLALEHLHKLGIIYRDIKLENILLDKDGHVVLTDFGLSKEIIPEEERAYSFCGTIEYMAPEVIRSSGAGHDHTVDFWSLGVLTYELLTGASPFTVEGEKNSQSEVSKRILSKNPPVPRKISSKAKDLIYSLLEKDPKKRLGSRNILDIKNHPFFSGLDWEKLAKRDIPAPFKPLITNDLDTSNFADEFTLMTPMYSPAPTPAITPRTFKGYSFMAPSVIFGKQNALNGDMAALMQPPKKACRPTTNQLASMLGESEFFKMFSIDLSEKPLGDGSFSICRRCTERSTGRDYAVKIVSRRWDVRSQQELQALDLCQGHDNIVKLHSVHYDKLHCYIVLELLDGGELLAMIRQRGYFTESEASLILRQVASAVAHMHSKDVVHRDLKPENIVFTTCDDSNGNNSSNTHRRLRRTSSSINTNMQVKVVDFGFARVRQNCPNNQGGSSMQPLTTPVFTLQYAAPEILDMTLHQSPTGGYDESCDLWSLGVILYAMLSGEIPFMNQGKNLCAAEIMSSIQKGEFSFHGDAWQNISIEAKDLVKGLLTVNPTERLKISDVLKSSWISGSSTPNTPLLSPGAIPGSPRSQNSFAVTFKTLNRVARKGFQLSEVNNAPLAKRRKKKRKHSGSTETRSSSDESSISHSSGAGESASTTSSLVMIKEDSSQSNIPSTSSSSSCSSTEDNNSMRSSYVTDTLTPEISASRDNSVIKTSVTHDSSLSKRPRISSSSQDVVYVKTIQTPQDVSIVSNEVILPCENSNNSPPIFDLNNNNTLPISKDHCETPERSSPINIISPSQFLNVPTITVQENKQEENPGVVTPSDSGYQSIRLGISLSSTEGSPPFSVIDNPSNLTGIKTQNVTSNTR
ncbi:ribosomal protein S6 kinase alpha-5-like [Styela clava]